MKLLAIFFIGTAFAETTDIDKVSEPVYPVCKDICLSKDHGGPGCVEGEENGVEQVLVPCYEGCVAQCEDMYKIIEANQVCPQVEPQQGLDEDKDICGDICQAIKDKLPSDVDFDLDDCLDDCEEYLKPRESCPDPEENQVEPRKFYDSSFWARLPSNFRGLESCKEFCSYLWDNLLIDEFQLTQCYEDCEDYLKVADAECPDPEDLVCPTCICECQECDVCEQCEQCPVAACPEPDCPPAECECTDEDNKPKEDKKTKDKQPGKGKGKGKNKGANGKKSGKKKDTSGKKEKDEKKKDNPKGGNGKNNGNNKKPKRKGKGKNNKKNQG